MVVEGEPGIFPDPIARLLRRIFRRPAEKDSLPSEPRPSTEDEAHLPPAGE